MDHTVLSTKDEQKGRGIWFFCSWSLYFSGQKQKTSEQDDLEGDVCCKGNQREESFLRLGIPEGLSEEMTFKLRHEWQEPEVRIISTKRVTSARCRGDRSGTQCGALGKSQRQL